MSSIDDLPHTPRQQFRAMCDVTDELYAIHMLAVMLAIYADPERQGEDETTDEHVLHDAAVMVRDRLKELTTTAWRVREGLEMAADRAENTVKSARKRGTKGV